MAAPRKYDTETRARADRMYCDRVRDHGESKLQAQQQVGALLDIDPVTLRGGIERPWRTTAEAAEDNALRRENAELRRANEILKPQSTDQLRRRDREGLGSGQVTRFEGLVPVSRPRAGVSGVFDPAVDRM